VESKEKELTLLALKANQEIACLLQTEPLERLSESLNMACRQRCSISLHMINRVGGFV
jgi:hypothetical protein